MGRDSGGIRQHSGGIQSGAGAVSTAGGSRRRLPEDWPRLPVTAWAKLAAIAGRS